MYAARQNKANISRQIDAGGEVRQKDKMRNLKNIVLQRVIHLKQTYAEYSNVDCSQIENWLKPYQYNLDEVKKKIVQSWINKSHIYTFIWNGGQIDFITKLGDYINNYKKRGINPLGHIELDTNSEGDTYEGNTNVTVNVHYKPSKISCKEYTNETKEMISGGFSGCLMAIFHCRHHIEEIKGGKDYVAHVANDNLFTYEKMTDNKNMVKVKGKGPDLLSDLLEFGYIKDLKYFRPSYMTSSPEEYKRVLLHLAHAKKAGITRTAKSEIGIIKKLDAKNINAYHKFEDNINGETNDEKKIDLTDYEDDKELNFRILRKKDEYDGNNIYDRCLLNAISANRTDLFDELELLVDSETKHPSVNVLNYITSIGDSLKINNIENDYLYKEFTLKKIRLPKFITPPKIFHRKYVDDFNPYRYLQHFLFGTISF